MKYFLIAGEASGDLHGSNLMAYLQKEDPNAEFVFCGGDKMALYGGQPYIHYKDMAFMGIFEVLKNIRSILAIMKSCKKKLYEFSPDVLILIDYPGFNLKMAEYAHANNIRVFYYISPKIWAWKKNRINTIKKYVNRMFVIFPFEVEFYNQLNFSVEFEGNPLLDTIAENKKTFTSHEEFCNRYQLFGKPLIALVAGSRKQEISSVLPFMIALEEEFSEYQLVVAGAPSIERGFYEKYLKGHQIQVVYNNTYQLIYHAKAAIVNSGTAALEAALIGTPQVVCYRMAGGKALYLMGKRILKIPYISLVNIIMNQEIITELIQHYLTKDALIKETRKLLYDTHYRQTVLQKYDELYHKLGGLGASERVARKMVKRINTET